MKARHMRAVTLAVALLWPATARSQQTAEEVYQAGIYQEEVQGNLERAIQIFTQLVDAHGDSRPIAAQRFCRSTSIAALSLINSSLPEARLRRIDAIWLWADL